LRSRSLARERSRKGPAKILLATFAKGFVKGFSPPSPGFMTGKDGLESPTVHGRNCLCQSTCADRSSEMRARSRGTRRRTPRDPLIVDTRTSLLATCHRLDVHMGIPDMRIRRRPTTVTALGARDIALTPLSAVTTTHEPWPSTTIQ